MAKWRRNAKGRELGTVSIGTGPLPSKVIDDEAAIERRREIEEDTNRKIEEYRKENPEEPKPQNPRRRLDAPLKTKRNLKSLDGEYIELAKRYIGMHAESTPTLVDFSKSIIKLFEDNVKLYKEISEMKERFKGGIKGGASHSWEQGSSWN